MTFIRTTAINKILAMTARKKVIQGGTSAGKTYAIIPILIDTACKTPRLKITVVAETIPAVRDGAVDIFKSIMKDTHRWIDEHWISNPMEYTFANKSRIQFKSFEDEGKAKASGKRDVLFINEGNHIDYRIADALMIRSLETYIDYNPDKEFWAHTELLKEHNSEFLSITYLDNEALPQETLEDLLIKRAKAYYNPDGNLEDKNNIKSNYHHNWWKVYGLGQLGTLQGVIFDNWEIIKEVPPDARLLGFGLDFGYTNHPTAIVGLYKHNDVPIYDEVLYSTGLTNADISRGIEGGINKRDEIIADSAEPKSIEEIRRMGWRIYPCTKGNDSINNGIQLMQQKDFKVTERSINLIKELRGYMWETDKTGKETGRPIDSNNHAIDAARYISQEKLSNKAVASASTIARYTRRR